MYQVVFFFIFCKDDSEMLLYDHENYEIVICASFQPLIFSFVILEINLVRPLVMDNLLYDDNKPVFLAFFIYQINPCAFLQVNLPFTIKLQTAKSVDQLTLPFTSMTECPHVRTANCTNLHTNHAII